jgi:hypothetical protein
MQLDVCRKFVYASRGPGVSVVTRLSTTGTIGTSAAKSGLVQTKAQQRALSSSRRVYKGNPRSVASNGALRRDVVEGQNTKLFAFLGVLLVPSPTCWYCRLLAGLAEITVCRA